jgi:hypothetical protein
MNPNPYAGRRFVLTILSNLVVVLYTAGLVGLSLLYVSIDPNSGLAIGVIFIFTCPLLLISGIASVVLNARYKPIRAIKNLPFKMLLTTSYVFIALWSALVLFAMAAGG